MLVPWRVTKTTENVIQHQSFSGMRFSKGKLVYSCLLVNRSDFITGWSPLKNKLVGLGSGNIPLPPKNDLSYAGFSKGTTAGLIPILCQPWSRRVFCMHFAASESQSLILHQELAISQRQGYLGICQTDQQKDFINDWLKTEVVLDDGRCFRSVHLPASLCQRSMAAKACQEG